MRSVKISDETYKKVIALKAYYEGTTKEPVTIGDTIDRLFSDACDTLKIPGVAKRPEWSGRSAGSSASLPPGPPG